MTEQNGVCYASRMTDKKPTRTFKVITPLMISVARRDFAARKVTVLELMQRMDRGDAWVRLMLRGKLDGQHKRHAIQGNLSSFKRHMTNEQVIEARRAYAAKEINQVQLARKLGVDQHSIATMLSGETYKDIPGAIDVLYDQPRVFTDEEVIEMRLAYRDRRITQTVLEKKYGVHQKTISQMLRGITYKHLPHAVEDRDGSVESRMLSNQQVMDARKLLSSRRFTVRELATYYRTSHTVMARLLDGRTYAEVPGALSIDYARSRVGRQMRKTTLDMMQADERRIARAAVDKLIAHFGGQKAAARALGLGIRTVHQWSMRGYIGSETVDKVAEVMGLPVAEMRPDMIRLRGIKADYSPNKPTPAELEMAVRMTLEELAVPKTPVEGVRPRFNMAAPNYDLIDA